MLVSRVLPKLTKAVVVRNSSSYGGPALSGPPTVRVPFVEKLGLAGVMVSSFLAYPIWVLIHLEEYKSR